MLINKPSQASISSRVIEYRKKTGVALGVMLCCPFDQSEGTNLWSEQTLWKLMAEEPLPPLLDEGVTKSSPEFLVHGYAYPTAESQRASAIRARFANLEKTLLAFGPRYWIDGKPSEPAPFTKIPVAWANAFGGKNFPLNPSGKGIDSMDGVQWLPNFEMPLERLQTPQQKARPAGFGAQDLTHPNRAKLRGTYDSDYLKLHSPGFPPDTDWRYFNVAQEDQWLESPLLGDEAFSFDNMHPSKPYLAGTLPKLKARVFADYSKGTNAKSTSAKGTNNNEPTLTEVPMRLTTVWFFPHLEASILLFQGLAEVIEDDGSDIKALVVGIESLTEPKDAAHYLDVLNKRKDPQLGGVHSLNDADLLPSHLSLNDTIAKQAEEAFKTQGLQADAQLVRAQLDANIAKESAKAAGVDPATLNIVIPQREKPPSMAELPAYMAKQQKAIEAQQLQEIDSVLTQLEKALAFEAEHGIKIADLLHRGPPTYSADTELAKMRQSGFADSGEFSIAKLWPLLKQQEALERVSYLQGAHRQPAAKRLPEPERTQLRSEMQAAVIKKINFFEFGDFTGADFSNLDLRGFNFANAWLESVDFSNANLSGCQFSNAVLAHSNLANVVAIKSNFSGANLGAANIQGFVADQSDFSNAVMEKCIFDGTSMQSANFIGTTFTDSSWKDCDWRAATLSGQLFNKLDLKDIQLIEADLTHATFMECDLTGIAMSGADVSQTTFYKCNLQNALMEGVKAHKAIFVEGTQLIAANLKGADLFEANIGGIDFSSAVLVRANLDGTNASGAIFDNADLRFASAKSLLGRRASFKAAKVAGVNFMEAILHHADMRGTDLRRCHFFSTDLSRIVLDSDTRVEQSVFTRARTYPRLSQEQQRIAP
jgi:uncharacterized protein YjbI with pentapeptide repeats